MTRLEVLKAEKEQIKGLHCLSFGLIDKCIEWYDKEIEAIVIHGADNKFYGQQADRNEFYNWDAPIRHKADGEKICGTCRNNDTYHCADCENKSDYEQAQAEVNAHAIQSALDNGTNTVIGTGGMRDATPEEQEAIDKYIRSISKPTGVNFWDLADGEYISRQQVRSEYADWYGYGYQDNWFYKHLGSMPSVAIPLDHDGCKDCVYQDNPQDAMPCRECKQNYTDKWKAMSNKEGHWKVMYEPKNIVVCSKCGKCAYLYNNRGSAYCPHCGDYKGGELNG